MKPVRLFFFLLIPVLGLARDNCWTTSCRSDGIPIRFPFWRSGQPQDCGYPGFDLSCNRDGIPVLNLSNSGSFLVRGIDYNNHEIHLYDASGCIQRRRLTLNLSSSPFWSYSYQHYTFLSCPTGYYPSEYQIECLSNLTNSIFANSTDTSFSPRIHSPCLIIDAKYIPVPLNHFSSRSGFSLLDDDLDLKWDTPFCNLCDATDTLCGSTNSMETEIHCFKDAEKDESEPRRKIILGIIIPTVGVLICIVCFKYSYSSREATARVPTSEVGNQVTEQGARVEHSSPLGLDESTIKSYTTIVVDESQHIPGPNGSSCSICLAEYLPGDTLRSIPLCEHCFHVDCIDEWLRLKRICPICRKTPADSINR